MNGLTLILLKSITRMKKRKPPQVIAWIVEGLDLCNVNEGIYEVICQPMKIENADGAPATVLIRKRR